jgi:general stress protein YciG
MAEKIYVFEYFLFVARRGDPPTPWVWEIRSKSKPDGRYFSADGFRSAKAAEEAGKIFLTEVRKATLEVRVAEEAARAAERTRRKEIAAQKIRKPLSPERRSENARAAAVARAKALSPERRSEIARKGGAASKGKPKVRKHQTLPSDSK